MPLEHMSIIEVRIPVSKLKLGMFVCRLDKEWTDSSFVFQGFLVNSDELIEQLRAECDYVYIDEKRGIAAVRSLAEIAVKKPVVKPKKSFIDTLLSRKNAKYNRKNTHKLQDIVDRNIAVDSISPPKKLLSFEEERQAAELAHTNASTLIKDFMAHVRQGGAVDIIVAKNAVYDCMSSILRSPDAMLLLIRLKSKNYCIWQHSMNVSVLAITLGRYLNLGDDELILLGLSGMFHDIGKLRISNKVLEQANNQQQLKSILDSHTELGHDILLQCMGQLATVAAEVAYGHHEHLDGTGFPRGLRWGQISDYTRMISIINTYDNLTSNKSGKKALSHYEAMTVLLKEADKQFDAVLLDSFNKCIGTYPVGCVVEMSSGEIAMVVEENEVQRLRPKIMLLTDPYQIATTRAVVNLADIEFTNEADSYFIKAIVRAEDYGIKL